MYDHYFSFCCQCSTSHPSFDIYRLEDSRGRGHCHYQMRENRPQKSTLHDDFMVDQKTPLTRPTGQISHPI